MRGMEALIEQRQRGTVPSLVMVDLDATPLEFVRLTLPMRDHKGKQIEGPRQVPQVFVDPAETIERLDLRPLIGLTVFAFGHDAERLAAFRAAALAHDAERVVTYDYTAGSWTDTAGHLAEA